MSRLRTRVLAGTLTRSGALAFLERAIGRGGVVTYHDVTAEPFLAASHITVHALAEQLEFLSARYTPVSLQELVSRRQAGRSVRGLVAVTFDDAYRGVLRLALPLLQRYQVPATIFVASGFCDGRRRFWWDRLERILQVGNDADFRSLRLVLGPEGIVNSAVALGVMIGRYRGVPDGAVDETFSAAETRVGATEERAMTLDELQEVAGSDLIDFGCHTVNHYALPTLDALTAEREIREAWDWIRERLPRARPYLAYPYGLYDDKTVDSARRAGMMAAFSIEGRAAGSRFGAYTCPRVGMSGVNDIQGLRLRLAWFTIPIVILRNRGPHPQLPNA